MGANEFSTLRFWPRTLLAYARFAADRNFHSSIPRGFPSPVEVPRDFFGINVAAGETLAHDDYVVARLRELGISCARMQFAYSSFGAPAERLLRRMLDEGLDVLLDLVPPFDEAMRLEPGHGVARWKQFVQDAFSAFSPRVSLFEIGSTSNRARWSGCGYRGYLKMWRIACECAQDNSIKLAGPNVSDFDPAYNIGLLSRMSRLGRFPDIHTNNLFVERAVEPEAVDLRKGGRIAAKVLKLDLARKAAVLKAISTRFGIGQTYCTHTCWTSKRLRRWNGDPAPKKADYLVRYLVIAAASGTLNRIYWGPLIGHSDGLIDDATGTYPATERVTHYQSIGGRIDSYRPEPAFYALKNVVKQLSGARFVRGAANGVCTFEFLRNDGATLHAVWTRDANAVPVDLLFDEIGAVFDCDGRSREGLVTFSERPVFLVGATLKIGFEKIALGQRRGARYVSLPEIDFTPWQNEAWQGAIAVERGQDAKRRAQTLEPSNLETLAADPLLRDKRNRVWCAQDPLKPSEKWVIKRIRVHGVKRFFYRVKASKAERNWNNAARMLRLGVATPMPVAYFEKKQGGSIADSYYVCRYAEYLFSARQAFEAFRDGFVGFAGISRDEILDAAASYVHHLHRRGIVHRDLSSGNLLFIRDERGALNATAIDIGRARFNTARPLTQGERFRDLMRICYKLDWPNRRALLDRYFRLWGTSVPTSSAVFLAYYDWKHRIKPMLKRTRVHASQRLRRR